MALLRAFSLAGLLVMGNRMGQARTQCHVTQCQIQKGEPCVLSSSGPDLDIHKTFIWDHVTRVPAHTSGLDKMRVSIGKVAKQHMCRQLTCIHTDYVTGVQASPHWTGQDGSFNKEGG